MLASPQIAISYTISQGVAGTPVDVRGFYSLNGPGRWQPATPFTGTRSVGLASGAHRFVWDAAADGLMGRSDAVVLRLVAAARPSVQPNAAAGRSSFGAVGAATRPFPVRGGQVQVMDQVSGQPVAGALVFRLPAGEVAGARPLGSGRGPYRSDVNGFLQGRGQINADDTLIALLPITRTRNITTAYTLFYTSAEPISTTIDASTVTSDTLLRQLFVSPDNPLLLFDLNVSLEWDARSDPDFLLQLEEAFQRASEVLYDLSNGQMALGRVRVFQNKEQWLTSDVQIYASNRVRPRASMGGIVQRTLAERDRDGVLIQDAYRPGAVRIGPVWDPFGQSRADLGRDWWRAFAHELGHHLLFLPDNYLGYRTAADGSIVDVISVDSAGSVMTTAYDDAYSEFVDFSDPSYYSQDADGKTVADWPGECRDTLAAHTTEYSDWEMIQRHYPMVSRPGASANPGPAALPLAVTQVQFVQPASAGASAAGALLRPAPCGRWRPAVGGAGPGLPVPAPRHPGAGRRHGGGAGRHRAQQLDQGARRDRWRPRLRVRHRRRGCAARLRGCVGALHLDPHRGRGGLAAQCPGAAGGDPDAADQRDPRGRAG
ncbi:MAG: hypothetical protein V9H69_04085 [Anaerolineae bacterium]